MNGDLFKPLLGVDGGWEGWGFRPDVICLRRRIRLVQSVAGIKKAGIVGARTVS